MTASIPARVLLAPIRFYQRFISPALPASCRYYPSCSSYAVGALQVHGALRGSWLAARRLGRCHPWHEGGYDPVPPRREPADRSRSSVDVNDVGGSSDEPEGTGVGVRDGSEDLTARRPTTNPDVWSATAETPTPRSHAA